MSTRRPNFAPLGGPKDDKPYPKLGKSLEALSFEGGTREYNFHLSWLEGGFRIFLAWLQNPGFFGGSTPLRDA